MINELEDKIRLLKAQFTRSVQEHRYGIEKLKVQIKYEVN